MSGKYSKPVVRCAIYTRKSSDDGLEQEFNSLDAQREAGEAYIASQKSEGWICLPEQYDDGGFTGGNLERPAMKKLLTDIQAGRIDVVIVYKVDRLSRSLLDFARVMETFDKHRVSFVSVTQAFNTTNSMGRLTLNVLLSFAQFEREIISERTRDKIAASRRKGMWMGGRPVLGYDLQFNCGKLTVNEAEAKQVREIFALYTKRQSILETAEELNTRGWRTKQWTTVAGKPVGGALYDKGNLFRTLNNIIYLGKVRYREEVHPGEHAAILDETTFLKAQAILRANGRSGGTHRQNKHGALLKTLLTCKACQCSMTHTYAMAKNRIHRYYACATIQKQGRAACPTRSLPAEQIEQFVVDRIRAIGRDPDLLAMTLDRVRGLEVERITGLESERDDLMVELRTVESEIRSMAASSAAPRAAAKLADLQDRATEVRRRLTEINVEVELGRDRLVTKAELDGALGRFDEVWANLSPRERCRVLRLLIRRVEFDSKKGTIAITFHEGAPKALLTRMSGEAA